MFRRAAAVIPSEILGVRVKPSTRARRMSLRTDARTGEVVLVWPPRGSERNALRFISEHQGWIEKQRAKKARRPPVADGAEISVLGRAYTIRHKPGRGLSRFEGGEIIIQGGAAHLPRRLKDFLKAEAERVLTAMTREKTARLGLSMKSLRIIDPKTRWGSCGPDGRLMFSWRLILASEAVMDYVVAHEVAHRVHMNHGRKFWALCASLTDDAAGSRRWLRTHGPELMAMLP